MSLLIRSNRFDTVSEASSYLLLCSIYFIPSYLGCMCLYSIDLHHMNPLCVYFLFPIPRTPQVTHLFSIFTLDYTFVIDLNLGSRRIGLVRTPRLHLYI